MNRRTKTNFHSNFIAKMRFFGSFEDASLISASLFAFRLLLACLLSTWAVVVAA
jgi:hypothetical protein